MKSLRSFFSIFAFVFALFIGNAFAAGPSGGTAVQVRFDGTSVGKVSWVPVFSATTRGISGMSVFSSAVYPLEVGVAVAGSAANTEVRNIIIPPMLSSVGAPGAVFYPLSLGYGARISIRAVGSTGIVVNSGEMDMSLFYN